jgi:hypothetical protein
LGVIAAIASSSVSGRNDSRGQHPAFIVDLLRTQFAGN